MRFLSLFLLGLLIATAAHAQDQTSPGLEVLDVKWQKVERNPLLEEDPFLASDRQANLLRAQQQAIRDNNARTSVEQPALPIPTQGTSTRRPAPIEPLPVQQDPMVKYIYRVRVRNNGHKPIRTVHWLYESYDISTKQYVGRREYRNRMKIRPGQTKELVVQSISPPTLTIHADKRDDQPSNRVVIQRIEYVDGSVWQRK